MDYGVKGRSPAFGTARQVGQTPHSRFVCKHNTVQAINILQNHYPERLGKAIIKNVPFLLNAFYKIIMPLMDPVTREKLVFNADVVQDGMFTTDMITKAWGGEREMVYEHDRYWPALLKLAGDRRLEQRERWRNLGGTVGVKEWDYKGGSSV